jgi:hypothetical protein
MNLMVDRFATCPHCGGPLDAVRGAVPHLAEAPSPPGDGRYDIAALVAESARDKAFDETTRTRVTQRDIQKLIEKRRKGHK